MGGGGVVRGVWDGEVEMVGMCGREEECGSKKDGL